MVEEHKPSCDMEEMHNNNPFFPEVLMANQNITLDTSTKLAYDRTRLAYERTLMAWVRTGTSLITFGFTIYKFFEEFHKAGQVAQTGGPIGAREFGIIMISIGRCGGIAGHLSST